MGDGTRFRETLTLAGRVDAVRGDGVFLHSLGAGGKLRKARHQGAQNQDEAQGCHLVTENISSILEAPDAP